MKLYIIRHGQTEWNITYKLQGKTDIPLNEEGRRQAEEAREIFNEIDIDLIICSTLDRAKETCNIINKDKNIPVIYDERICERNHGVLEGVDARTIDFDELINYYIDKKIENGESIQEFYNRIYKFLDELEQKYKNNEKILLVTHGDVSRAVNCYFNGIPEDGSTKDLMINNCEIKNMKNSTKEYLYKKEYIYLYLVEFTFRFGNALTDIFGTVMLYKKGIPIYLILLIYGLQFGVMGVFSPLFIKIASKYGITFCRLLSNICRIISCYMLISNRYNLAILIITMGLAGSLSNPIGNAISARYIDQKNRGKYNGIRTICNILGKALASIVITMGIIADNNICTLILVIIAFSLQIYFTKKLDYKPENKCNERFIDICRELTIVKTPAKKICIAKAFNVIEMFFVPLYIYIALDDFVAFSLVVIVSLTIQSIVLFISRRIYGQEYVKDQ